MKIDPCPCVISLKDSSVHTLFEFRHFLELVEDCMGYDAAKWLRTHVEQAEKAADYTQAKVDTDLTAYESDLGEQPQSLSGYSSGSRRNYPSSSREAG